VKLFYFVLRQLFFFLHTEFFSFGKVTPVAVDLADPQQPFVCRSGVRGFSGTEDSLRGGCEFQGRHPLAGRCEALRFLELV
ncbi:unnamed protein product, partial [Closterium sp. NIES-54]